MNREAAELKKCLHAAVDLSGVSFVEVLRSHPVNDTLIDIDALEGGPKEIACFALDSLCSDGLDVDPYLAYGVVMYLDRRLGVPREDTGTPPQRARDLAQIVCEQSPKDRGTYRQWIDSWYS
ncbi:MAG: hypothetical protein AAGA92_06040 [Planctomycetota bacterium]